MTPAPLFDVSVQPAGALASSPPPAVAILIETSFVRIAATAPTLATVPIGVAVTGIKQNLAVAAVICSVTGTLTRLAGAKTVHPSSACAHFAINY